MIPVISESTKGSPDRPDLEVCGGAVASGSVPKVRKRIGELESKV